jgi:hypothetical protein
MITTPDHDDALSAPPAFSTVGPKPQGFYGDCDPATGQEGTTFRAEEFNEVALNLRKLLTDGKITPVKGNASMVLNAILALIARERPYITTALTLNVSTAGVANPVNPLGGDPFNSVAAALAYLTVFRLNAPVTIQVAAGTYNSAATTYVQHVDGSFITIQGAARATTILHFTACTGMLIDRSVTLRQLTIEGDKGGAVGIAGLYVRSPNLVTITDVITRSFKSYGILVGVGANVNVDVFECTDNSDTGCLVQANGSITAGYMLANANVTYGILVSGGSLSGNQVATLGGVTGLHVDSNGLALLQKLQVGNATDTTRAVLVRQGGVLLTYPSTVPGDWYAQTSPAGTFHTFRAEDFGAINAGNALIAGCRAITSPAVNTLGNVQAYIKAV